MKYFISTTALAFVALFSSAVNAGSLSNGVWAPSNCGAKPVTPSVDDKDVDTYNKSVANINDWQQKAKAYYACLVNEANVDNGVVIESANREQAEYKKSFETIKAALDAAAKKVDK
jgi:hypothetical protein